MKKILLALLLCFPLMASAQIVTPPPTVCPADIPSNAPPLPGCVGGGITLTIPFAPPGDQVSLGAMGLLSSLVYKDDSPPFWRGDFSVLYSRLDDLTTVITKLANGAMFRQAFWDCSDTATGIAVPHNLQLFIGNDFAEDSCITSIIIDDANSLCP